MKAIDTIRSSLATIIATPEQRAQLKLSDPEGWEEILDGKSSSGVIVNRQKALQVGAAYACISRIARDVARIPIKVYQRTDDGRREATDHPLHHVLHVRPNSRMTPYHYKLFMMFEALTGGNHVDQIIRDGRGNITSINPIPWDAVTKVSLVNDGREIEVQDSNAHKIYTLPPSKSMHIRGLSNDGIIGMSPIKQARHALGFGIAARDHSASVLKNNARPGLWIKPPTNMDQESRKSYVADFKSQYGKGNVGSPIALLPGTEIDIIPPLSMKDLEFVALSQWSEESICRFFDMSPFQIGSTAATTYNNLTADSESYLGKTLDPWLVNIEEEMSLALLTSDERAQGFYIEFLRDAIVHIDLAARTAAYKDAIFYGWKTLNDIRKLNNDAPYPPEIGDVPLAQSSLAPLASIIDGSVKGTPPTIMEGRSEPNDSNHQRCCNHNHVVSRVEDSSDETRLENNDGATWMNRDDGTEWRWRDVDKGIIEERHADGWREIRARGNKSSRTRVAIRKSFTPLLQDNANRVAKRLKRDIHKEAVKQLSLGATNPFVTWLENYMADQRDYIQKVYAPALKAMADAIANEAASQVRKSGELKKEDIRNSVDEFAEAFAARTVGSKAGQIKQIVKGTEPERLIDAIDSRLDEWEEKDSEKIVDDGVQFGEFVAKAAWTLIGVSTLVWSANANACPFCEEMDGRTAEITKSFVSQGGSVNTEGEDMEVTTSKAHPPIHGGCECFLSPGF